MTGLVLSSVILFTLLIPGIVFQFRYYRTAAGSWQNTDVIMTNVPRALLMAVVVCLPMHALWISVINALTPLIFDRTVEFGHLLPLLQGEHNFSESPLPQQLNDGLLWAVTAYLWTQILTAQVLGEKIAIYMEKSGRSKKIALSSKGAMWHRLFKYAPEDPELVLLSLTVPMGETVYIYSGLLQSYELDNNGRLNKVVLEGAMRRKLTDDSGRPQYYELPGESFVVDCGNVETYDVDYFWIENKDEIQEGLDQIQHELEF